MTTFVLVSGAWHAGWCWERVTPLLEAKGHRSVTPDLLGMGADKTPLTDVSLALWADQITGIIRTEPEPVVLLGHSRGGIVISEVAERVPERIVTLIYLAALLLPDGVSVATSGLQDTENPPHRPVRPDGATTVPAQSAAGTFYNTTEPAWIERAIQNLGPEPAWIFHTPLALSDARYGRVPRAYIECAKDRALALERQRAMQATLPCAPVITLQCDHSPFYSCPENLVDAMLAIAADQDRGS